MALSSNHRGSRPFTHSLRSVSQARRVPLQPARLHRLQLTISCNATGADLASEGPRKQRVIFLGTPEVRAAPSGTVAGTHTATSLLQVAFQSWH